MEVGYSMHPVVHMYRETWQCFVTVLPGLSFLGDAFIGDVFSGMRLCASVLLSEFCRHEGGTDDIFYTSHLYIGQDVHT